MSNDQYTFTESLKSETILALLIFIPLLFTISVVSVIIYRAVKPTKEKLSAILRSVDSSIKTEKQLSLICV